MHRHADGALLRWTMPESVVVSEKGAPVFSLLCAAMHRLARCGQRGAILKEPAVNKVPDPVGNGTEVARQYQECTFRVSQGSTASRQNVVRGKLSPQLTLQKVVVAEECVSKRVRPDVSPTQGQDQPSAFGRQCTL